MEENTKVNDNERDEIVKNATEFLPDFMNHVDGQISSTRVDENTIKISDSISDTFITRLKDGTFSFCHCDHFGIKSQEDFDRANEKCAEHFIDMCKKKKIIDDDGKLID